VRQVLSKAEGIKLSDDQQLSIVAYADDLVIIAENEESLKQSTKELIMAGKEIGLHINGDKTKYLILSRQHHTTRQLEIEGFSFERIEHFKYLGAWVNENANSQEEIRKKLIAANRCYFGLSTLFKSKLLSRRSKTTLYKVLIRPIALYASETWATTKMDKKKLDVFERKILRKIFGPKMNEEGEFEIRTNEELRKLFREANIIGFMKSTRIRWTGHVWRSEGVLGSITKWRPNTKRPRGRPRQRWADRIKDDLKDDWSGKCGGSVKRQRKVEGRCCSGNGP